MSLPPLSSAAREGRGKDGSRFHTPRSAAAVEVSSAADNTGPPLVALPRIDARRVPHERLSHAASLQHRLRHLEEVDRLESLRKQESALRSTVMGLEYEERYRRLWAYHREGEQLQRGREFSRKSAAARQQANYLEAVRAFQRWGSVWTEEMNAREELVADEQHCWELLLGGWEVAALQTEQRRLQHERSAAEERWEATESVRRFEVAVGLSALRHQKAFSPKEPLEFVSSTVVTGVADERAMESKRAKVRYLMDYTVNEEEFTARQIVSREETLERVLIAGQKEKCCDLAFQESKERLGWYECFYAGWNEHRLARVLTIQRWWRQLRSHPWSYYRRFRLHHQLHQQRLGRTTTDFQKEIARLEGRLSKAEEEPLDLHLEAKRLLTAAESCYAPMLDQYVFSVEALFHCFVENQRHRYTAEGDRCVRRKPDWDRLTIVADESNEEWARRRGIEKFLVDVAAHTQVPPRLFTRFPLPYRQWRLTRWIEFAESTRRRADALRAAEGAERHALETAKTRATRDLRAFHSALRSGEGAVRAYLRSMACVCQTEREDRHVWEQQEEECRAVFRVERCRLADLLETAQRPVLGLLAEMQRARRELLEEEAKAWAALREANWRWDRLAAARARLAARYHCRFAWEMAVHGLAGTKFVSLQSVAGILIRFVCRRRDRFRCGPCREEDRVAAATQELLLELRAAKLTKGLEALFKERRRHVRRQEKHRRQEIEANRQRNGSRGFLSSERCVLAGFSYVVRQPVGNPSSSQGSEEGAVVEATPPAAIEMGDWLEWYNRWLEENAEAPRESEYQEVLKRFQRENQSFYNDLAFLLSLMRAGRQKIEEEEALQRGFVLARHCYRQCAHFQVTTNECRARQRVQAEEADARYHLIEELRQMKGALRWGARAAALAVQSPSQSRPGHLRLQTTPVRHVFSHEDPEVTAAKKRYVDIPYCVTPTHPEDIYRYVHNGPSLAHILAGRLFPDPQATDEAHQRMTDAVAKARVRKPTNALALPTLSAVERFMAREEVRRARVQATRKRELAGFLADYALPFRAAVERDAFQTCVRRCGRLDKKFPCHPPLAAARCLVVEEAMARAALETEAVARLQVPLLAAHRHFAEEVVGMQFTFGHLTMSSHGLYLDRRLVKLLTQRVQHVKEKTEDLVHMEEAARSRLEYIAEITAELRFRWKKLIL